jgi:hypothetical protein
MAANLNFAFRSAGSTLARVILVLGASPNARRAGVGSRPVGALAATSNV